MRLATNIALLLASFTTTTTFCHAASSTEFRIENAMPSGNILDLKLTSRITLPYGPDLYQRDPPQEPDEQPYQGYGAGMGAAESIQYDPIEKYLYSMSDVGYIIVADYQDPRHPKITEYSYPTQDNDLGSIEICPSAGLFFVSLTDKGQIDIYNLVQRKDPKVPTLQQSLLDVPNAKTLLTSSDCQTLVAANENSGDGLDQGSVTIVQDLLSDTPKRTTIPLDYDEWDDAYLLRRGLNMPLTKRALEYWDDHSTIADDLDFENLRANYKPAIFLEPANLAWNSPAEEELLVNMQENNGLLRINMTDLTPVAAAGYGLKDHSIVPIDVNVEDGDCNLKTYPSLFAMRNPDIIETLKYNDKYYVITANEGSSKDYEDWEEEWDSNDLFKGNEFGLKDVTVPRYIFDPNNTTAGHSALFNDACGGGGEDDEEEEEDQDGESDGAERSLQESDEDCLSEIVMSVGSNSIDYESDPSNPIFHRMVLFGGRGWSIYELPNDPDDLLKLVFDSADAMEADGCHHYPWSHNAIQDEEFANVEGGNNTYYKYLIDEEEEDDLEDLQDMNDPEEDGCEDQGDGTPGACPMPSTVDEESGDAGPSIENVIIGQACGRLVAAVAAEQSSVAMLFDITDITSPDLIKVFHLSPASETKSMGLAYNNGELGEIDPESGVFLTEETSPSGKAGILWAGAKSGTVAFWEFECKEEASSQQGTDNDNDSSSASNQGQGFSGIFWCCSICWIMTIAIMWMGQ